MFMVNTLSISLSYCLSRTLGNSIETCLIVIGSSILLSDHGRYGKALQSIGLHLAAALAVIAMYIRPTSAAVWLPLFIINSFITQHTSTMSYYRLMHLRWVKHYLPVGMLTLYLCILIDSYYYQQFTLSPFNFYVFNVLRDYASLFGTKSWHWYFTEGFLVVLGFYCPIFYYGLCRCVNSHDIPPMIKALVGVSLFYACVLTGATAHKEHRFLLPCLPFLHLLIGRIVHDIVKTLFMPSEHSRHKGDNSSRISPRVVMGISVSLLLLQSCCLWFLIRYHQVLYCTLCAVVYCSLPSRSVCDQYSRVVMQRGPEDAFRYIAGDIAARDRQTIVGECLLRLLH